MSSQSVTIIIPLYNNEQTIERAINSALAQTHDTIEIIVIDDASTDSSATICKKYSEQIKILHNSHNIGLYNSRLKAQKFATGKYITFVDADDWLGKNAIKCGVEIAEQSNADIVQMKVLRRVTKLDVPIKLSSHYNTTKALDACLYDERLFPVACWSKLYKSSLLQSINFPEFEQFWGEDRIFNMKVFSHTNNIALSPRSIYNYKWGGSTMSHFDMESLQQYKQVFTLKSQWAKKNGLSQFIPKMQTELLNLLNYHIRHMIDSGKYSDIQIIDFLSTELSSEFWAEFKLSSAQNIFNQNRNSVNRRLKQLIRRWL